MLVALVMTVTAVNAQTYDKQLQKQIKKEYKQKMKSYEKEGWKLYGSSHSLSVALLTHYSKLEKLGDKGFELMGEASRFKSKNVGHQMAVNNACNEYARQAGSHVKGRIVSDTQGNVDNPDFEFDKFYSAYESLVDKEIKGELQESYSIIKDNGDGTYAMRTFFIVDADAATQARIRAMENAMKESEAAQKYANKVSEFVREGFKTED